MFPSNIQRHAFKNTPEEASQPWICKKTGIPGHIISAGSVRMEPQNGGVKPPGILDGKTEMKRETAASRQAAEDGRQPSKASTAICGCALPSRSPAKQAMIATYT